MGVYPDWIFLDLCLRLYVTTLGIGGVGIGVNLRIIIDIGVDNGWMFG